MDEQTKKARNRLRALSEMSIFTREDRQIFRLAAIKLGEKQKETQTVTIKIHPSRGYDYIVKMELPLDNLNITSWIEDNLKENNVESWDYYDE